jgi:ATP-dependent Clp protease protease subunit
MKKLFYDDIEAKSLMLFDKIYLENLKDRKIILNGEIESSIIDTAGMMIKKFNKEDEAKSLEDRVPIELHINSYGGSVYDGFSLVSTIVTSKTPVHGYCDGYAMSMGLAIFTACHKRFSYPFTSFMYHEVATGVMGKNEEIERVAAENKRIQKKYDGLMIKNTTLTQAKLDKTRKSLKDWYFDSTEAKEFGLVHEIIE